MHPNKQALHLTLTWVIARFAAPYATFCGVGLPHAPVPSKKNIFPPTSCSRIT